MNIPSYPCFYPGEFSPPTKYHLNTLHWLLAKPEIHHVNVVIGSDQSTQLSQKQKQELWDMLFKSSYAPQATILKAKQHGPISHIYETFNKDKKLPAYIALDEKSSRNKKLQEKFERFPYFGIQIVPSQFHKSSKNIISAAQQNNVEGVKKELPDDFSDDMVQKYMEIINPKNQQIETFIGKESPTDYKSRYTQMFNKEYWDKMFQPMAEEVLTEATIQDGIKKKAVEKFKKENPALTDDQINSYISSFEKNMEKPVIKKKDILQYTWDELEQLVDGNFGIETISKPKAEDIVDFKGSEDVVYNENGLLILLGDIREKCIRYGQNYTWCISRADTKNMFYTYRMRMNEPVFYFIFDEDKIEKDPNDKYHAMVIYVNSGGKYMVADATNPGDKSMSWEEIVKIQPKLKELKSLIKHVPLTAEERADYKKYKDRVDDETYNKYTYDQKYKYIQFGHDLTENQVRNTPKELISRYASTSNAPGLPKDVENQLSGSDKKILLKNRYEYTKNSNRYKDMDIGVDELVKYLYYPENVTNKNIKGNLILSNTEITSLPNNLKVSRDLDLNNTRITSLPDNLKVGRDLYLGHTEITSLPDNLKVNGNLNISNTKITSLPNNLKVALDLNLDSTEITSLPDNLKVGRDLKLGHTKITSLPDNLEVPGDLDLAHTKITSLPDNLKVGVGLYLSNSEITSLPDNLEVPGNLDLTHTKITSLPDNLKVGVGLYLAYTKITSLPNNLKVAGNLDLTYSKITSLPDNLKVGMSLYLGHTEITSLPDNLEVPGDLDLAYSKITSLPNNLKVKGDLSLSNTKITSLPDNLEVNGSLNLTYTKITSLPDNLKVGVVLWIDSTPLEKMPIDQFPKHLRDKIEARY